MRTKNTNLQLIFCLWLFVLSSSIDNLYFGKQITINQNQSFFIADPLNFTRVVQRKILLQAQPLKCAFLSPSLSLNNLAQYRLGNLESLEEKFNGGKEKIISASFDWADKAWLLISDGSILQLKVNSSAKQFKTVKKYYIDKSISDSGRFFGQIYCLGDHVFVKYRGLLYSVFFKDNSWQLEYQYTVQPVFRVKINKEDLYFMTHQNLYRIQKDKTYQRLSCLAKSYFKDFDVNGNNLLTLTSLGVLSVNKISFSYEGMERIEHIQQAKKIRISQNFMLIYFKRRQQEIILQYYMQKLKFQNISTVNERRYLALDGSYVREGKLHRQFKRVENILMYSKYAIVQQKFQISFFEINIHTKNPLPVEQNLITVKKQNILGLEWQNGQIFMFEDNKVKLFIVQNSLFQQDLFRGVLSCVAEQQTAAQLQVEYKGICSNNNFQKSSWQCEQVVTYSLNIYSNDFFELFSKWQIVILIFLLVCVISTVFFYKRLVMKLKGKQGKQNDKSKMLEMYDLKSAQSKMEPEESK